MQRGDVEDVPSTRIIFKKTNANLFKLNGTGRYRARLSYSLRDIVAIELLNANIPNDWNVVTENNNAINIDGVDIFISPGRYNIASLTVAIQAALDAAYPGEWTASFDINSKLFTLTSTVVRTIDNTGVNTLLASLLGFLRTIITDTSFTGDKAYNLQRLLSLFIRCQTQTNSAITGITGTNSNMALAQFEVNVNAPTGDYVTYTKQTGNDNFQILHQPFNLVGEILIEFLEDSNAREILNLGSDDVSICVGFFKAKK